MAFMMFVDESGHDRRESPYEVLAGVAIQDRDVWPLIEGLSAAEERHLGVRYSRLKGEIKGKHFLKAKTFRLAQQSAPIPERRRAQLARECLLDGAAAGAAHLTALSQAKLAFVSTAFDLCLRYDVRVLASIVLPQAPRSESNFLRKDYAYLFERFFYLLEDHDRLAQGLVVFDELERSQSHILIDQMERYFLETARGRHRSRQIIPEPFFVHSDLTSLIQIADLVAYVVAWGFRVPGRLDAPGRSELAPYAKQLAELRYRTFREITGRVQAIWGFAFIDDLRSSRER